MLETRSIDEEWIKIWILIVKQRGCRATLATLDATKPLLGTIPVEDPRRKNEVLLKIFAGGEA